MAYDVFVSYNSSEQFAQPSGGLDKLISYLRNAGLRVWRDKQLTGSRVSSAIKSGLKESKHIMVVVGRLGLAEWQEGEVHAAKLSGDKPIVPVLIDGLTPKSPDLDTNAVLLLTIRGMVTLGDVSTWGTLVTKFKPESLQEIFQSHVANFDVFLDQQTGAVRDDGRHHGGRNEPPFLYTEATGYAIQDLLELYGLTRDSSLKERAARAARWIEQNAVHRCGGVLTRKYFEREGDSTLDKSFASGRIYSFDTAICLAALVALQKSLPSEERGWVESLAQKLALFLVERAKDGLPAIYDGALGAAVAPDANRWSAQGGVYQAKIGGALAEYASIEGVHAAECSKAACTILDSIAETLGGSGEARFQTSPGKVELHPLCYAAEGLVTGAAAVARKTHWWSAARATTKWLLEQIDEERLIAQEIVLGGKAPQERSYRVDGLAQLLALAVDLDLVREFRTQSEALVSAIRGERADAKFFPLPDRMGESTAHARKRFFKYGYFEDGVEARPLSYWTNMFCARALMKYYMRRARAHASPMVSAGGEESRYWPVAT